MVNVSESEVFHIFCSLGLETEEKRKEILSRANIGYFNLDGQKKSYKTWFSNGTVKLGKEESNAGLERDA